MDIYSYLFISLVGLFLSQEFSLVSVICGIILAIFFLCGFASGYSLKHKQNGAICYNYFLISLHCKHKGKERLSSREETMQIRDKLGLGESLGGQQPKISTSINRDNCTHSLVMPSIPFKDKQNIRHIGHVWVGEVGGRVCCRGH